jgi:1,4-alpha-glucan branching enzyme
MKIKLKLFKNKNVTNLNPLSRFALQAPTARQVSLAGDFNNWDPKAGAMHKGPDGVWHLGVALKPGRHEYRFLADEVWCDDPAAAQRVANPLGTQNCVRMVAT